MKLYNRIEFSRVAPSQEGPVDVEAFLGAGFAGVEVGFVQPYLDTWEVFSYLGRVQELRDAGLRFTVHAPLIDVNLASLNRAVRRTALTQVKECLDFARQLEASVVVVHPVMSVLALPDGPWNQDDFRPASQRMQQHLARSHELCVEALQELADYAKGLKIAVENLVYPHERYRSPQQLAGLLDDVQRSNVGATLDVGHAWCSGHDPASFVPALGRRLFHVHLHDNHGRQDEHLPLGTGTVPLPEVLQALGRSGYDGILNLECSWTAPQLAWLQEQFHMGAAGHSE